MHGPHGENPGLPQRLPRGLAPDVFEVVGVVVGHRNGIDACVHEVLHVADRRAEGVAGGAAFLTFAGLALVQQRALEVEEGDVGGLHGLAVGVEQRRSVVLGQASVGQGRPHHGVPAEAEPEGRTLRAGDVVGPELWEFSSFREPFGGLQVGAGFG